MSILKEKLLVHQVLKITEQEQLFLSHEFIGYHKGYHFCGYGHHDVAIFEAKNHSFFGSIFLKGYQCHTP